MVLAQVGCHRSVDNREGGAGGVGLYLAVRAADRDRGR
ncbi:hypothetical protein L083_7965 [Actinoplanes sp. N902-109]|nr:hypothetical protein L083_7965 [Actinoplanes sp. N902-109]